MDALGYISVYMVLGSAVIGFVVIAVVFAFGFLGNRLLQNHNHR
ncbi:MAG: hypothetical protein AB7O96_11510 [Pseudobdellovibrionaceae bacterium]